MILFVEAVLVCVIRDEEADARRETLGDGWLF